GGVLLLLSVFFAYVLAPAVAALRRRIRLGRRQRPISAALAIALIYAVFFVPGALIWRSAADAVSAWVHVTAPAAVDHLFGGDARSVGRLAERAPLPEAAR